ncbi:hypothetical protein OEZ85_002918 [Tetradesmus obliquus]|uniref:EGF-like domain-containing protein n=1 Tax=Tetradesmus obliquus TaxID=3088 RepID=A0ABY8TZH6_TETOB|nr:hypothetical protein OEZ85_002918 [Tetradesmus obliquus]
MSTTVGPCGSLSDDLCAADVNAVNGSCTAVSPDSYRCQCMQGYNWSNETSSCLPALAIAIGVEKGSSPQSWRSFILDRNSAIAVGDAGAVVWWDGKAWKVVQPLHGADGTAYDVKAVALYAPT